MISTPAVVSHMMSRNKTDQFQSHREQHKTQKNNPRETVIEIVDNISEPQWMKALETVNTKINQTRQAMVAVEKTRQEAKRITFDPNRESKIMEQIKVSTQQIFHSVQTIYQDLENIKAQFPHDPILHNAIRKYNTTVQDLFQTFKTGHINFSSYISSIDESVNAIWNENKVQKNEVQIYDKNVHKYQQITDLSHSIQELNMIFMEMSRMVQDQGTMLDRIEDHIIKTHDHIQSANNDNLAPAEQSSRNPFGCYCIGVLIFFIIILIIVIIFKFK